MEMMEMEVLYFTRVRPPAEGFDENVRHAGDTAQMDMVAAFYALHGLVGGNKMQFFHIDRKYRIYFVFL